MNDIDLKPLKRFGQNYLQDKNILGKIVDVFVPDKDMINLEIGPGLGNLTEVLMEKLDVLYAVEIDRRVIEYLRERFPNLKIFEADFMDFDLRSLINDGESEKRGIKIIGNIPYNITSPILFKLIENRGVVKDSVLLMQLEVASRLVSKRGTKDYGILGVVLGAFADIELCFKVSPNVFYPRPKVWSALVRLVFRDKYQIEDAKLFISLVKESFGNRRKTLRNSLLNSKYKFLAEIDSGIDLGLRAENLSIDDYMVLYEYLLKHGQGIRDDL